MSKREFGRRRPATYRAAHLAADDAPGLLSSKLAKQIAGVLAGVALAATLMFVHDGALKGFGRMFDQYWAASAGYPAVDDAYARTKAKDAALDQAHNACKARSDFAGRGRTRGAADPLPGDAVTLARSATYLSCLANEKPERFCQASHRAHLLAATTDYYRLMAKMEEERRMNAVDPIAMDRVLDNLQKHGTPPPLVMPTTGTAMPATSTPEVAAALRALVVGGYVGRRELLGAAAGWPNDLDTILRDVTAAHKGCG
jgi:hypothetical protein